MNWQTWGSLWTQWRRACLGRNHGRKLSVMWCLVPLSNDWRELWDGWRRELNLTFVVKVARTFVSVPFCLGRQVPRALVLTHASSMCWTLPLPRASAPARNCLHKQNLEIICYDKFCIMDSGLLSLVKVTFSWLSSQCASAWQTRSLLKGITFRRRTPRQIFLTQSD